MDIEQKQEVIAKFMGMTLGHPDENEDRWKNDWFGDINYDGDQLGGVRRYSYLHFVNSWDWLIPVVKKITRIYDQELTSKQRIQMIGNIVHLDICKYDTDIVFSSVYKFIDWYNKEGKLRTYSWSLTSQNIWTSFDHGEVEAYTLQDAYNKAVKKFKYELEKINTVLQDHYVTKGLFIDANIDNILVKLKQ